MATSASLAIAAIRDWPVRVANDPAVGNGPALWIPPSVGNTKGGILIARFPEVILSEKVGEQICLRFDFWVYGDLPGQGTTLRFGIFHSNGTPITGDGFFNSNEVDDFGVFVNAEIGGGGTLGLCRDTASPLGGPGVSRLSQAITQTGMAIMSADDRYSARLTVKRTAADTVAITGSIAGKVVTALDIASSELERFDEVAIKYGGVASGAVTLVVDNVTVETVRVE